MKRKQGKRGKERYQGLFFIGNACTDGIGIENRENGARQAREPTLIEWIEKGKSKED